MCGGGGRPTPAPRLPEAPVPPQGSAAPGDRSRDRRRKASAGGTGTILTGSSGVIDNAPTQQKTLLGA